MANNSFNNQMGHKRCDGGGDIVHTNIRSLLLSYNKGGNKMGAKIGWVIVDWLGVPAYMLGVYFNFDNIKSAILFIVGLIYVMMRAYYYGIQKGQAVREKELDLWHKEQDKQDRINKNKK